MITMLIKRFGKKVTKKSCISGGAESLFKKLMSGKGFGNVVEIGTAQGISAAVMAGFADHVYTFDIVEPKHKVWRFLGIKNITLIIGQSRKRDKLKELDFDFAFIDGNHEGHFPATDFAMVKKCGRVLFHDINRPAVKRVIDSLDVKIYNDMAYWENL